MRHPDEAQIKVIDEFKHNRSVNLIIPQFNQFFSSFLFPLKGALQNEAPGDLLVPLSSDHAPRIQSQAQSVSGQPFGSSSPCVICVEEIAPMCVNATDRTIRPQY